MFYILLSLLSAGVACFGITRKDQSEKLLMTGGGVAFWIILTAASTVRFVPSGFVQVPSVFGKYNTDPSAQKTAGVALKLPWESLTRVEVRTLTYIRNDDRPDRNEPAGTIYIQQQPLKTDGAFQYRVNESYAGLLLAKLGPNWHGTVANAVSSSLRTGGVVLNKDGTPLRDEKGRIQELTLEEAQGSKRTVLQQNVEIAFRTTLASLLKNAGFTGDQQNAIIAGQVTLGETEPPKVVLDAIATVEARTQELKASQLLVKISENRTKALAVQGNGVRSFLAQAAGQNIEEYTGAVSADQAVQVLLGLNLVEQTTNVRLAIEKGQVKMVIPSGTPVAPQIDQK